MCAKAAIMNESAVRWDCCVCCVLPCIQYYYKWSNDSLERYIFTPYRCMDLSNRVRFIVFTILCSLPSYKRPIITTLMWLTYGQPNMYWRTHTQIYSSTFTHTQLCLCAFVVLTFKWEFYVPPVIAVLTITFTLTHIVLTFCLFWYVGFNFYYNHT